MLILQDILYKHPDHELLFEHINLTIADGEKSAIVGNNGSGKSTLLNVIARNVAPSSGTIAVNSTPYYLPQHFGQLDHCTLSEVLLVKSKLDALYAIIAGSTDLEYFAALDDDWAIEEKCRSALNHWGVGHVLLNDKMGRFSGGEKTRILLAGLLIHQPQFILFDEPTNHLDWLGRQQLYSYLHTAKTTAIVVSHDRTLLNQLDAIYELNKDGIRRYGGNYEFYLEQKRAEIESLREDVRSNEKMLREAQKSQRKTIERKQKLDARGKKKQEKSGVPTIMMNTLRNNAEASTAKLNDTHSAKINSIAERLAVLRDELPMTDQMRLRFDNPKLREGKVLVTLKDVQKQFSGRPLWTKPLNLEIASGERITIKGINGSGKTTLLKIIAGAVEPDSGSTRRANASIVYLDQDYSLVDTDKTIAQQAASFNTRLLADHEIKNWLTRFLFTSNSWNKKCRLLSGGEKMRLALCCIMIRNQEPDIIILDEPTNNLDLTNVQILTNAVANFGGTMLVVSHDAAFIEELAASRQIDLDD